MPSGEFSTGPSAVRIGGFTLVGIGVLALFFGVATAFTGGSSPTAQPDTTGGAGVPPPASTSSGEPNTGTSAPVTSTTAPEKQATSEPAGSSASEPSERPSTGDRRSRSPENRPSGSGKPGDGNPGSDDQRRISLRVYNNSRIDNLAHRAARDLRGAGFEVVEVGNYSGGRIPVTTVYYRPDTGERAQARTVAQRLGARAEPRFNGISDASPGVIVIVTKNYDGVD